MSILHLSVIVKSVRLCSIMAKANSSKPSKHVTINVECPQDTKDSPSNDLESRKSALRQPLLPLTSSSKGTKPSGGPHFKLPSSRPLPHVSSCEMLGDALAQFVESDDDAHTPRHNNHKRHFHSSLLQEKVSRNTNAYELEGNHKQPEGSHKRTLLRARTAPLLARSLSIHKVKQKKVTRARVMMLQAAVALAVYMFLGTLVYALQRNEFRGVTTHPVIDSMYYSMVTMTTTGYGDLVPQTKKAKLVASAFAFAGLVMFGVLISGAGHYLIDKQERLLLEAARRRLDRGSDHVDEILQGDPSPGENRYWKLVRAAAYIGAALMSGMIVLIKVEGMDWVDALYCACVSVTSIGYGDRSFRTPFGRLFATGWLLLSVLTVAKSVTLIAEARLEARQKKFVHEVLCKGMTSTDFQAADIDNDGSVGLAEFAVFKLREMGKIAQDDLNQIRAQYQKLDLDDLGRLHIQSLPDYC